MSAAASHTFQLYRRRRLIPILHHTLTLIIENSQVARCLSVKGRSESLLDFGTNAHHSDTHPLGWCSKREPSTDG